MRSEQRLDGDGGLIILDRLKMMMKIAGRETATRAKAETVCCDVRTWREAVNAVIAGDIRRLLARISLQNWTGSSIAVPDFRKSAKTSLRVYKDI